MAAIVHVRSLTKAGSASHAAIKLIDDAKDDCVHARATSFWPKFNM